MIPQETSPLTPPRTQGRAQDTAPAPASPSPAGAQQVQAERVRARRRAIRIACVCVALLIVLLACFTVPVQAVIESPGPTWNVLGTAAADGSPSQDAPASTGSGQEQRLITVTGAPTYPTSGALRMTTVSVRGCPGYPVTVADLALAWLRPQETVVDRDSVCPRSMSAEQVQEANQAQMTSSENAAVAAALLEAGVADHQVLTVVGTAPDQPAELREGDVLRALTAQGTGTTVPTYAALRETLAKVPAGTQVTVTVERSGSEVEVPLTTLAREKDASEGAAAAPSGSLLGVYLSVTSDAPVEASFALEDVGGPSAGLMFALGIVDTLTPEDLTGGLDVAGTGTMSPDGSVGPIGGVAQKMAGASRAGSRYFLAPAANCAQVVGHEPSGMEVYAVSTLHEAVTTVRGIASGQDEGLRTCQSVLGR